MDTFEIGEVMSSPLLWAETFLIYPETGEKFKANYIERRILSCESQRVVIRCHRRGGKSVSLAILCLWAAMVHKYYDVLVVAPGESHVAELFETIDSFIQNNQVLLESISSSTKSPHLRVFKNGSTIKGNTTGAASNRKALSLRGKGANLIVIDEAAYLAEKDFDSIIPIITGDKYKNSDGRKVRAFAASTPTEDQLTYYNWCRDKEGVWHEIHVPITENPDFSEEEVAERRAVCNERQWICEQLAEFLDAGENAFKNSDIDKAKADYRYDEVPQSMSNRHRAIGIDWDKVQAGVNIVVVDYIKGIEKYNLVYRYEVPRGEYTLTEATAVIIKLNDLFKPDFIYVDRGFGEQAVEELKLYGKKNPESGLHEKLRGFNFNERVDIVDPVTGQKFKAQFKSVMLNTMTKLFEDGHFQFSKYDKQFEAQLRGYKILSSGSNSIKTTRKNEHIIDAVGLACYAIHSNYNNRLKFEPAAGTYVLPTPKVVPSKATIKRDKENFRSMTSAITDKRAYAGLGRGTLGYSTPTRVRI